MIQRGFLFLNLHETIVKWARFTLGII